MAASQHFFSQIRTRLHHHKSTDALRPQSKPDWDQLPVAYRPVAKADVRTLPRDMLNLPTEEPVRPSIIPQQQAVQKQSRSTPVLLQLPRPRGTWKRSLDGRAQRHPTERLSLPDADMKRMTVDLACALPPLYFDLPPEYDEGDVSREDLTSERRREEREATFEKLRQPLPSLRTSPVYSSSPKDDDTTVEQRSGWSQASCIQGPTITVDSLLSHPMLKHG